MANSIGVDEALSYKECSVSFQKVEGEKFKQLDVSPQMQAEAGDAILDLGCGTGQLSAYLAELVGPEGKVVAVDPDKERILLAQQSYSEVKNLSFVERSASNFPGIGSESYDVIFSNYVIHWIPDKQDLFNNMFESLKCGGKIAIQFLDGLDPSALHAFKVLNPENADRIISRMLQCEDKAKVKNYCSKAGFHIVKCYHSTFSELVFQSIESVLKWLSATTHGAFDPKLVTEERLQKYYPYSSRDGKPPFDLRAGFKDKSGACRLVAVKPAGQTLKY